jgi:CDP-diacylglycerol pyrophosphatase
LPHSPPPWSKRAAAANLILAAAVALSALAWMAARPAQASRLDALKRMVGGTEAAHPNALWHIVHGLCLRDMKASGNPAPCAEVNLASGYAVVKDVEHKTQYLLIPSARVTGIESPALLATGTPNYWQAAWTSRRWLEQLVGRPIPREDVGLAINSMFGRTQNQLHIHIDCVRPEVRDTLRVQATRIGPRWSSLKVGFGGRRYRARWIQGPDLGATDPFKLLARTDPVARADMGRETLVLIGASRLDGTPGFVLLSDRADDANMGAGERLLDHRCHVLSQNAPG